MTSIQPSLAGSAQREEKLPNRLIDTHAHVHFSNFAGQTDRVLRNAEEAGVTKIITVGVNTADSRLATGLAARYEGVWASVGIHPHDAAEAEQGISYIAGLADHHKVVAIGECGLDFYKSSASPDQQEQALRLQIDLATQRKLPVIFHVREAYGRFLDVLSDYSGVKGVVHSFTGGAKEMEAIINKGLYVAFNGIMTFTKNKAQLEALRRMPLDKLLLETDCPFLSPIPYRGKLNEPARMVDIAEFVAGYRGEAVDQLAAQTTVNAEKLFGL